MVHNITTPIIECGSWIKTTTEMEEHESKLSRVGLVSPSLIVAIRHNIDEVQQNVY